MENVKRTWNVSNFPNALIEDDVILCEKNNVFLENSTLSDAIDRPRIHHGGQPDHVLFEPGSPSEWLIGLERRGHAVSVTGEIGQINAFHCEVGLAEGDKCFYSSDPRGHGLAIGLNP